MLVPVRVDTEPDKEVDNDADYEGDIQDGRYGMQEAEGEGVGCHLNKPNKDKD